MVHTPKTAKTPSIGEEHLHLREIIFEFRVVLATRDATRRQVATRLKELTQQVLDHFDHEESGGYFGEAIDAAPRLSERADALLAEHAQMAEQLVALQHRAATQISSTRWWHALESDFIDFMDRFSAHEKAENALLQEAYFDDIGAED